MNHSNLIFGFYVPIDPFHCGPSLDFKQNTKQEYRFRGFLTSIKREIPFLSDVPQ